MQAFSDTAWGNVPGVAFFNIVFNEPNPKMSWVGRDMWSSSVPEWHKASWLNRSQLGGTCSVWESRTSITQIGLANWRIGWKQTLRVLLLHLRRNIQVHQCKLGNIYICQLVHLLGKRHSLHCSLYGKSKACETLKLNASVPMKYTIQFSLEAV